MEKLQEADPPPYSMTMANKQEAPPQYSLQSGYPPHPAYPPSTGYYGQPQPGYTGQAPPGFEEQPQTGYMGQPQHGYPAPGPPMNYNQYGLLQQNVVVTQQPGPRQMVVAPYSDQMTAAILVTLFCFWPTGIIAILRASDARSALARGDVTGAALHARSAKSMVIISIVIGIISFVIVAVILGVYFGLLMSNVNRMYD